MLLTPYTAETHGIVSAAVLGGDEAQQLPRQRRPRRGRRRAGADRGPAQGGIAGAALDVFAEEPLPSDHPFWAMENVLITPHTAGFHVGYADDALPIVEENIRRFLAGDVAGMTNVVRT